MAERTVMIFDQCGSALLKFYVLKGNYSHLDGVCINTSNAPELQKELIDLMYDEKGIEKLTPKKSFPKKAVIDGAYVIVCTFPP